MDLSHPSFRRLAPGQHVATSGEILRHAATTFGDKIGMLFGSANRDPRAFDDPDAFHARRHAANHVGFGGGTHHCLGAPLARIELAEGLATLAKTAPEMELRSDPVRHRTFTIHGYESVPIRLRP